MKIEEYAWNEHEQKLKRKQIGFRPSSPKIKIVDDIHLRNLIEERIESLPQKEVAKWALKLSLEYLVFLDEHLKDDPRINLGIKTLEERIEGNIRAYDLRQVGFLVNQLAKESKTDKSKYSARTFAQAIATGHMRGHAMVCSDYAIKVTNGLTDNSLEMATKERERQLEMFSKWLK
ncbi:hypothetical protein LZ578_05840 [Jeotgalibaca sp. MA1X17-3]|uniref:putative immunity protein n=1 Tax=Jeotgalibaca sp. MA1X17-3 TaxID=2908211 RepID=UPI001F294337|nr:hypothetical protein [Jeotgalibaca sp. MA1X17-3]UJF16607.1 hypothetical protein LZ578_05840 [Jeotgalibaca sp. MA1X17-3]